MQASFSQGANIGFDTRPVGDPFGRLTEEFEPVPESPGDRRGARSATVRPAHEEDRQILEQQRLSILTSWDGGAGGGRC